METCMPIYEVNFKNIKVKISDGTIVTGKVNVVAFNRLSDYLKRSPDNFITISEIKDEHDPNKIVIINRNHIIWVDTWED